MFLDTIPVRGMPPRGSAQDYFAQEMLSRRRRAEVAKFAYLGRMIAASITLPEPQYQFLTEMLAFELHHDNYNPKVHKAKIGVLRGLTKSKAPPIDKRSMTTALKRFDIKDEDLTPLTPEEQEQYARRIRKIQLKRAEKRGKEVVNKSK